MIQAYAIPANEYAEFLNYKKEKIRRESEEQARLIDLELKRRRPGVILKIVSSYFNIPEDVITGPSQKREVCDARFVAMDLLIQETELTLKSIGEFFGGRDHSTVVHARKAVQDLKDTNETFRNQLSEINNLL